MIKNPVYSILDIISLIEKAKDNNVSKLDLRKDGSISIEFSSMCRCPEKELSQTTIAQEEVEMEKISKEVTEEEELQLTQEAIEELQTNDPHELERLLELGYVVENEDGALIPSFK